MNGRRFYATTCRRGCLGRAVVRFDRRSHAAGAASILDLPGPLLTTASTRVGGFEIADGLRIEPAFLFRGVDD